MDFVDLGSRLRALAALARTRSLRKARRLHQISRRPVVIGGCGRSGTSLLLSVLSCHPRLFAIDHETVALCPDGYGEDGMYNRTPDLSVPLRTSKLYDLLANEEIGPAMTRWCEKTPRNVLYFPRILRYYGKKVRLLHIIRDGRDVCTSKHPLKPDVYWTSPHRWVQDVGAGLEFEHHPQCLTIRYERLLTDFEQTMRRICEFIDEPFTEAFLRYPESAALQRSLAWKASARPLSTAPVGKWKRAEFVERVEEFWQEPGAEELMNRLGYTGKPPDHADLRGRTDRATTDN